jgi:hypothetical protein
MYLATILVIALSLWFVHWLTDSERRPLTLFAARLLRRAGRWLWAVGLGLEHGFLLSQQVKRQISLDLDGTGLDGTEKAYECLNR